MAAGRRSFRDITGQDICIKAIDIGANPIDGDPPYGTLLRAGQAEVVGFEPDAAALATLNARKGPHERYFPHAVGDGGRHTLRICQAPGMTSLLEPAPATLNLFHGFPDWGRVLDRVELDTVRLDDVPETEGANLLKLDIQGAELMVLRHAEARLRDALVVQTEVEFLPLYRDQPLFGDVDAFLRGHGFAFHRFHPLNSRVMSPMVVGGSPYAGLSQMVWADAIFIRDLTRLDALEDRALLAMATILHDCYGSADAVLRLLMEHDRRHEGQLAARYLAGL